MQSLLVPWNARRALAIAGLCGILCAAAGSLPAQESGTAAREPETVFSLILKGRWIMIPMGICSILTLTFAIERAVSWRKVRVGGAELADQIIAVVPLREQLTQEKVEEGLALCDGSRTLVGKVLRAGVEKLHRDEAHARQRLEDAANREAHVLKRKLRVFSVISALAPLLGLLGTISGMITCFEKATSADSGSRVTTLTEGIYEALVATATGLLIAIIALILYHYFMGVVDRIIDKFDEAASRFLEHYYGSAEAVQSRAAPGGRQSAHHRDDAHRHEPAKAGGRSAIQAGK